MLARGSDTGNGVADLGFPIFSPAGGAGEGDLETMIGIEVPGGGAPLTI